MVTMSLFALVSLSIFAVFVGACSGGFLIFLLGNREMADRAKEARLQKEVVLRVLQEIVRTCAKDGYYKIQVDSAAPAYVSIEEGKLVLVQDAQGKLGWQTVMVDYPKDFHFVSVVHVDRSSKK